MRYRDTAAVAVVSGTLVLTAAVLPTAQAAGSAHPGGFNAAFADGSVRYISSKVNLDVWKALITRASGEIINANAF